MGKPRSIRRPDGDRDRPDGRPVAAAPGSATTSGQAFTPRKRATGTPSTGLTRPIRQLLGQKTGSLRPGSGQGETDTDQRLRVDWPQCKAHGLCAEIAPEVIQLDEWGYPVFDPGGLSTTELATARKAVHVCPTLALRLTDVPRRT